MEHHIVPTTEEHQLKVDESPKGSEGTKVSSKPLPLSCIVCSFLKAEFSLSNAEERSKSAAKLCRLIFFYLIVMAIEIVGGLKSNSLAVLTDAAHLLSDIAGFSISLFSVWASGWEATSQQSFGFHRLEVLGAFLSVELIWLISGTLVYAAGDRLFHKNEPVNGKLMFIVATFGCVINLIMVLWLGHGHDHGHDHGHHHSHDHGHSHTNTHNHGHIHNHSHDEGHGHSHSRSYDDHGHTLSNSQECVQGCSVSPDYDHSCPIDLDHTHCTNNENGYDQHGVELCEWTEEEITGLVPKSTLKSRKLNINIQGAYLHVFTDLIQTIGVMIAGVIIWAKPNWLVVDLICTLVFALVAISTTIPMLRNIYCILLESTPSEIDVDRLKNELKCMEGIKDVHDMHVWTLTVGKTVLACHVIAEAGVSLNETIHKLTDYCQSTYGIQHVTIQIEEG
ncbi:metal tolerance protein 1-like [Apium graveolens]|uniref:metal tolerance protein 1-like n=1 Tax=Apium graveolens TaxID=4045 RepID=UPI003D79CEF3